MALRPDQSRSNNILMARVRELEHTELVARKRATLLRGFMFVHLKKELAVQSVNWIDCDYPKESAIGGAPATSIDLTSYGIRGDVQNLLSGIRTDLDAFSEAEALALMTSGYRMVEQEFPRSIKGFSQPGEPRPNWRFLAAELFMKDPASREFTEMLRLGGGLLFKAPRLIPGWRVAERFRVPLLALAGAGMLGLMRAGAGRALLAVAGLVPAAFYFGGFSGLIRLLDQRYLRFGSLAHLRGEQPFAVTATAKAVKVDQIEQLWVALEQLGVRAQRPVAVLVGGASNMAAEHLEPVAAFFKNLLVPLIDEFGGAIIDGGTNAGIMRLIGEERTTAKSNFPLIGVAAKDMVRIPGRARTTRPDAAELEACHTHFLLVPGSNWGDESSWLAHAAAALADDAPSFTLVINGGAVAAQDALESCSLDRPVIALKNSGGLADVLSAAAPVERASRGDQEKIRKVVESGLLSTIDIQAPQDEIRARLRKLLDPTR